MPRWWLVLHHTHSLTLHFTPPPLSPAARRRCAGNYSCKQEPKGANAAPKDLFTSGGVNAEALFMWAFQRQAVQDSALVAARALAREARTAEFLGYYEALLAQSSGAFSGGIGEVLDSAAGAVVGGFEAAKWTYVTAWSKAPEPTFLRSLFEDSQGLLERACGALRGSLQAMLTAFQQKQCTVEEALRLRLRLINERDQLLTFQRRLMDVRGWRGGLGLPGSSPRRSLTTAHTHTH